MRMAALSVSTEPSGSNNVGIWHSGLTRCNSSRPGPGSHDAASMLRKGSPSSVSAASTAAEPEPLVPKSAYVAAMRSTSVRHVREAALDLLGRNVSHVRADGPHVPDSA